MKNILLSTDPISEGYIILVTGVLIVFSGLVLLALFFNYVLPNVLYAYNILTREKGKTVKEISPKADKQFTGEVAAAISIAIHMYLNEQHDHENAILTIKQARKLYSPWSSKIYGMYTNRL